MTCWSAQVLLLVIHAARLKSICLAAQQVNVLPVHVQAVGRGRDQCRHDSLGTPGSLEAVTSRKALHSHHGSRIPRSCGNALWQWYSSCVLRRGNARGSIARVGHGLGINTETLRNWVQKAEVDSGQRPGTTSDDKKRIAELERKIQNAAGE